MQTYTECEICGAAVEVERTHNGICYCWHYVHCGWGHVADDEEVFTDADLEEEVN